MGTMMKNNGLAESFETAYGLPSVHQMSAGKAVLQALRGQF